MDSATREMFPALTERINTWRNHIHMGMGAWPGLWDVVPIIYGYVYAPPVSIEHFVPMLIEAGMTPTRPIAASSGRRDIEGRPWKQLWYMLRLIGIETRAGKLPRIVANMEIGNYNHIFYTTVEGLWDFICGSDWGELWGIIRMSEPPDETLQVMRRIRWRLAVWVTRRHLAGKLRGQPQ